MKLHDPRNQKGRKLLALDENGKIDQSVVDVDGSTISQKFQEVETTLGKLYPVKEGLEKYESDGSLSSRPIAAHVLYDIITDLQAGQSTAVMRVLKDHTYNNNWQGAEFSQDLVHVSKEERAFLQDLALKKTTPTNPVDSSYPNQHAGALLLHSQYINKGKVQSIEWLTPSAAGSVQVTPFYAAICKIDEDNLGDGYSGGQSRPTVGEVIAHSKNRVTQVANVYNVFEFDNVDLSNEKGIILVAYEDESLREATTIPLPSKGYFSTRVQKLWQASHPDDRISGWIDANKVYWAWMAEMNIVTTLIDGATNTVEEDSNKLVTSQGVYEFVEEKLAGIEDSGGCDCEPVDLQDIKDALYGSMRLIDSQATFNADTVTAFCGFRITTMSTLPKKLRSIVLHDVQNSGTRETPLVAVWDGIQSYPISSWEKGDDIEFIFPTDIDCKGLSEITIQWVAVPANESDDTVPQVKYDASRTNAWFNLCAAGPSPWLKTWNHCAPNMSIRWSSKFDELDSKIDDNEARIDSVETTLETSVNDTLEDYGQRIETLESYHNESSDAPDNDSLQEIEQKLTELTDSLVGKADKTSLNDYVTKQQLSSGVSTQALTVTGNNQEFSGVTKANLDLGFQATLTSTSMTTGNISLGGNSTLYSNGNHSGNICMGSVASVESDVLMQGNLFAGMGATIKGGNFSGAVVTARTSTISSGMFNGDVTLGDTSTISGGTYNANLHLGYGTHLSDGKFYGNILAGSYINIDSNVTESRNFWVLAGLKNSVNLKTQLQRRLGIIIVGNGAVDIDLTPSKTVQVLMPSEKNLAARVSGWEKWENDFNVVDAEGNEIIKNGVLTVTGNSSGGIDEEALNEILNAKGYLTAESLEGYVTSEQIANFVTNEEIADFLSSSEISEMFDERLRDIVTTETVKQIVSTQISSSVDSVVEKNLETKLFNYITFEDFTNQLSGYVSDTEILDYVRKDELSDEIDKALGSGVDEKVQSMVEESLESLNDTFATKEELSSIAPLVYGSFGFPDTTAGNYNSTVAILGDKYNPKNYGKLHSISIQLGSDIPASQNGYSTEGDTYMYIGKWDEATNRISEVIEVSTNSIRLESNKIVTYEFDSDADYSDTDKICFFLHNTNDKTAANVNTGKVMMRAKVGPVDGSDSYLWNVQDAKGNYMIAFMARCEVFGGGKLQIVDYVEANSHAAITSNAVYKELSKVDARIAELESNNGGNSDGSSEPVDTSSFVTKTVFNRHEGDYDMHWASGEKSELYDDIYQLQEAVRALQSSLQKATADIASLRSENATLRASIQS